jgi:hypothetical protein
MLAANGPQYLECSQLTINLPLILFQALVTATVLRDLYTSH